MARAAAVRVVSVGYAGFATNAQLAAGLRAAGVERLIDVRALANSRRRGFSKRALAAALAQAGIEYVHVRELGSPLEGRELYRSGRIAEGRARYRAHLRREGAPALAALAALVRERRCALMCVERDPAACHRTALVESLRGALDLPLEVVELSS